MTGTPSRTATAYGGGTTRHPVVVEAATPQGYVGRKLQAKLRSEEHEAHRRQPRGGRGRVGVQSPNVIRTRGCICDGYVEQRSRVLPREICLSVCDPRSEKRLRHSRKRGPGRSRMCELDPEQTTHHAGIGEQTREAERSTMDSQKSAESISCPRTTTKEEHEELNRNGAFDG